MAHVHGTADAAKSAVSHALKGSGSMGAMMEQMPAGHMMANMPRHTGMAAMGTAAVAATTHTGRSFLGVLSRNPLLIFGLGVAAGYYAHKYRKEIIRSATSITDKGKDFVQPQKKNLEDLVSECKECADDESSEGKTQGKKT